MRLIPVLDIRDGLAVHAVAGKRSHYQPLVSPLHSSSDPLRLALAIRQAYRPEALYLADLDAIESGTPSAGLLLERLHRHEPALDLWLDPGLRDADDLALYAPWLASSRLHLIAALESLAGPKALSRLTRAWPPDRLLFSLDLFHGQPRFASGASWATDDPVELARLACLAGLNRLIVLDVGQVGRGQGPGTLPLLQALHHQIPDLQLIAGGGINTPDNLPPLAAAGVTSVLIGTAIQQGRWPRPDPSGTSTPDGPPGDP